uniref:Uncharacterized protein n=1 Tax=Rhizophora mucronata TaxID=61149 RepID=A0A2P2N492_RHIMU
MHSPTSSLKIEALPHEHSERQIK